MGKPDSILGFKLMSFSFKIRDLFLPRINILNEVGIKPGSTVLDYGCGSGSYILQKTPNKRMNQTGRSQVIFRKGCADLKGLSFLGKAKMKMMRH